jgi:hypothetical protein
VFGTPDDDAFGLLGLIFKIGGTEEWLHLAFNAAFLASLYLLCVGVLGLYDARRIPLRAVVLYGVFGVLLETWHMVEHGVIISNVIHNHGCPCPGIGDAALGVSDTQLHFVYNAIAYLGTLMPAAFLIRGGVRASDGLADTSLMVESDQLTLR